MGAARWPLTLVRRGAKVPDDGSRWWQELPTDSTAESVRSVGYEVVDVVPARSARRTRTGHEVGAIYAKTTGGAYLVLGETESGEVEVEQVVKGPGPVHYVAGDRWTHRTSLDHTDRKIGVSEQVG